MNRMKATLIRAALFVLGMSHLLYGQDIAANGPQFCPPLGSFTHPTLLDVLIYPGFTAR